MRYNLLLLLFCFLTTNGQNHTSYFTGNLQDTLTNPLGGVCLMGGSTEDDNAMKWFLQRANGGDVLVLRASGSDGYNDYFFSDLGETINSVETIVFNNTTASNETYIHQKIEQAEAIWFAGGDQWDYVSYWRNTAIDGLINEAINNRNIVIGGTSAGMAIQGGFYFSAQYGTVTSETALANPFDNNITVDSTKFLSNKYLEEVVTDTHYDDPDRIGRHITFLARMVKDYGVQAKGIACDEYTAVCIDTSGLARVFGEYPDYDDNAYFIQTNCEVPDNVPENCESGQSLTWDKNGQALKVYTIKGTIEGDNTFDLSDWQTAVGGTWNTWSVNQGVVFNNPSDEPDCMEPEPELAYVPLSNEEDIWYHVNFTQYKMLGDTLIDGLTYRKVFGSEGDSSFNQSTATLRLFIREENKQWFTSSSELPLLSFDLNPGEEIEIAENLLAKSLYIDSVLLGNGEQRRRHHIEIRESIFADCSGNFNCYQTEWIEGIGSVEGFYHSNPDLYYSYEDGNLLLCYESESESLYTRWDSIGCNMKKIGVGLLEVNTVEEISVSPNPTNNFVTFKYPVEAAQKDLLIYNALGQVIKRIRLSANQQVSFSVRALDSGIYYWQLGQQSGKLMVE